MDLRKIWHFFGHAFTCKDLYRYVNPLKWNIPLHFYWGTAPIWERRYLCGAVLNYLFFLIICDIIENNITFEFPLQGGDHAYMYSKCFQDDDFKQAFKRGKFNGIDFLKSEFKGYQLYFQWHRGMRIREKPIYISSKLKDWFYTEINSGKQYY